MIVEDLMRGTVGIIGARQSLGCAGRLMRCRHPDALVDEPVEQCATRMAFQAIQQMPVVEDASGRILGMVTFADIRRANPRDV